MRIKTILLTLLFMFAITSVANAGLNKALSLKEIDAKTYVSNNKPITWVLVSPAEKKITISKLSKLDRPEICMQNSVGKIYLSYHLNVYNKKVSHMNIREWKHSNYNMKEGLCIATVMPIKYFNKYLDSNKYTYEEIEKPLHNKPKLPF